MKRIIRTLLKNFFRFLGGLLDRIIAVFGAVGLAQFPQFFSQYIQRLGGHLAEAQFILVRYEMTAEYFGIPWRNILQPILIPVMRFLSPPDS